jgi:hypothetical protein
MSSGLKEIIVTVCAPTNYLVVVQTAPGSTGWPRLQWCNQSVPGGRLPATWRFGDVWLGFAARCRSLWMSDRNHTIFFFSIDRKYLCDGRDCFGCSL